MKRYYRRGRGAAARHVCPRLGGWTRTVGQAHGRAGGDAAGRQADRRQADRAGADAERRRPRCSSPCSTSPTRPVGRADRATRPRPRLASPDETRRRDAGSTTSRSARSRPRRSTRSTRAPPAWAARSRRRPIADLTPRPATQNYPPCDPGPGDDIASSSTSPACAPRSPAGTGRPAASPTAARRPRWAAPTSRSTAAKRREPATATASIDAATGDDGDEAELGGDHGDYARASAVRSRPSPAIRPASRARATTAASSSTSAASPARATSASASHSTGGGPAAAYSGSPGPPSCSASQALSLAIAALERGDDRADLLADRSSAMAMSDSQQVSDSHSSPSSRSATEMPR